MQNVKKTTCRKAIAVVIPFSLSLFSACTDTSLALFLSVAVIFFLIGAVPLFRQRANLWMFLFVGIAGSPWNIRLAILFVKSLSASQSFLRGCLWGVLAYFVLFSIEQLIFGMIARLMHREQTEI